MQTPSLTLTLQGNSLIATDTSNHSVTIPADVNGVRLLKLMLQNKNNNPHAKFASKEQPVQEMVDAFLKAQELVKQERRAQQLTELMEDF